MSKKVFKRCKKCLTRYLIPIIIQPYQQGYTIKLCWYSKVFYQTKLLLRIKTMNKFNLVLSVDECLFIDMFRKYNRIDNFTYQGLQELFNHLDDLADEMGEPIELDVISLCCEYYEGNAQDIADDYKSELEYMLNDEYYKGNLDHIVGKWLQDEGILMSKYDVNGVTHFLYRPY